MLEEGDDLLDRVFHAVELAERRIAPDDPVSEDPAEPLIVAGIDQFRYADAGDHAFGCGGVGPRVALAQLEILFDAQFLGLRGGVIRAELFENRSHRPFPKKFKRPPGAEQLSIHAAFRRTKRLTAWYFWEMPRQLLLRRDPPQKRRGGAFSIRDALRRIRRPTSQRRHLIARLHNACQPSAVDTRPRYAGPLVDVVSSRASSPLTIRRCRSLAPPTSTPLTNTIGKVGQPVHIFRALRLRQRLR